MTTLAAEPASCVPRGEAAHGKCVGGYRLLCQIGRGRHSTVYLGRGVRPGGRVVALKLVRRSMDATRAAGNSLAAQFSIQAMLAHPHVLEVFAQGESEGDAYLAMEHAAGGALAAHLERMEPSRGVGLLADAASALASLHRNGWVHRDVKPGNLLLRADGRLVLADFGSACRAGEGGGPGEGLVVGSPRYAAAEQLEGAPADPSADVYGLGVCFYEMLCGKPLFPGATLGELAAQHLVAPIPRLAGALAPWQPLLDAMVAKLPRQRLPDAQAVLEQLERTRRAASPGCTRRSMQESRN
jgi:serine/threonine protein kinase